MSLATQLFFRCWSILSAIPFMAAAKSSAQMGEKTPLPSNAFTHWWMRTAGSPDSGMPISKGEATRQSAKGAAGSGQSQTGLAARGNVVVRPAGACRIARPAVPRYGGGPR